MDKKGRSRLNPAMHPRKLAAFPGEDNPGSHVAITAEESEEENVVRNRKDRFEEDNIYSADTGE